MSYDKLLYDREIVPNLRKRVSIKVDKVEYKLRADRIKSLVAEKKYREAVEIADTIDWKNVRNSMMLCTVSDLYKICKRFEDSRDVLQLAYQRTPGGRMILYSLCELSIKLGDVVNAIEYYKEFVQAAPQDTGRFVLRYKLYTAQEVSLEERISVLEELQQYECKEKWMYELAYLYHMIGYGDKCVEECNQIIIYFGEGKYVLKALELKANHEPLSYEQDILYKRLTGPKENDILVKDMDVSKFNTIDLQKELANSLAEVLYDDTAKVSEPVIEPVPVAEAPVEEVVTYEAPAEEVLSDTIMLTDPVSAYEEANEPEDVDDQATRVINTREVEEAVIEEQKPSISRTVVPSRGFGEMREVMPQSLENSAIAFRNYDDMVSMEGDGQISFNVPEQEMVEKQITGQISIEDIMAEWERMKAASERKWRDDMRRKVIQQTTGMFKDFDENSRNGLLEELESEVENNGNVVLTKQEEENLIGENIIPIVEKEEEPEEVIEETTEAEEEPEVIVAPEEIISISEPVFEEEPVEESRDIREIVIEEEPTPEELTFDRTPFIADKVDEVVEAPVEFVTEVIEDSVEEIVEEPIIDDYLDRFARASEERDNDESINEEVKADEELEEIIEVELEEVVEEELEEVVEEESEEIVEEEPEEIVEEESETVAEEETEEIVEEASEEVVAEEPEVVEEEESEEPAEEPEEFSDGLTEEQEERFESYIRNESGREQVVSALSLISMESNHGNAIIGSEDTDGSVDLGIAFIRELSSKREKSLKVGKTKASSLNAKSQDSLKETLERQYGCALIIQDANELRPETLDVIVRVLSVPDKEMFVIFTASKRGKHRFLMNNGGIIPTFDISIDIEALTNKELAAYARDYAYSREYGIDEMGMLALHTRIEERQTNNHSVTVSEVRTIIDGAISQSVRKTPGHFFETLVGKRYDDNDMIVLKEKDFSRSREKDNESDNNN